MSVKRDMSRVLLSKETYQLSNERHMNCPTKNIKRQKRLITIVTRDTAQEWTNRTPNATNLSIPCFLVLPGSESTITEITEYVYFSRILSDFELQYKIE